MQKYVFLGCLHNQISTFITKNKLFIIKHTAVIPSPPPSSPMSAASTSPRKRKNFANFAHITNFFAILRKRFGNLEYNPYLCKHEPNDIKQS